MTITVFWEDHYDPAEEETEFDNLVDALAFAGVIIEEGGSALVFDENGVEYSPF